MAKHKQNGKPPARPAGTVAVRLDLLPGERDRLRILAAHARVSMSEYVRQLARKNISENSARLS